ncbi:heme-copper oxidase subunit III [Homoserinibacter sp. GY 40078]|uniref:aa3-type cytochrome oxidase subunit III n=1 Tax=Homoserinibacter sp. GY 40078 TaxID=2603275 RepID=UPI0011CB7E6E|nr:heme-copper oxidase subunit III [Homoserinibacter sp. GY 40078]TXK17664.1 heme-copper oxidase subunit III [Homoserinibacter sp. GY 40078]
MTTTSAVSAPSTPVINRPNPVSVGTIVWLGSEVMFFAGLFAVFFTLHSTSPELFASQSAKLNIVFSGINTAILVLSSVTAQMGVRAAEAMQPRRTGGVFNLARWGTVEWFFLSFFLGATFVVGQIYEYGVLVSEHVGLSSDSFGSVFYFATGFHGLHVTGGLIAFLLVIGRIFAVKNFTHKEATSAIVVSYYWHFVDVVWIALFLAVYILPLAQ